MLNLSPVDGNHNHNHGGIGQSFSQYFQIDRSFLSIKDLMSGTCGSCPKRFSSHLAKKRLHPLLCPSKDCLCL
jgi:hypothetical protein